jgi:hypothetical protein
MTAGVDDELTRQALRLALGAELTHRAGRITGARIATGADLAALAHDLRAIAAPVERAHRLRFDPPYPGLTAGVQGAGAGRRLVLACTVLDAAGTPEATVFTTLIAGRPPLVTAAPAGAEIPAGWSALGAG